MDLGRVVRGAGRVAVQEKGVEGEFVPGDLVVRVEFQHTLDDAAQAPRVPALLEDGKKLAQGPLLILGCAHEAPEEFLHLGVPSPPLRQPCEEDQVHRARGNGGHRGFPGAARAVRVAQLATGPRQPGLAKLLLCRPLGPLDEFPQSVPVESRGAGLGEGQGDGLTGEERRRQAFGPGKGRATHPAGHHPCHRLGHGLGTLRGFRLELREGSLETIAMPDAE